MTGALYLVILLGSLLFPLGYTIIKLDVIKQWKAFFTSTLLVALVFLVWDLFFTHAKIWGFNEMYCLGICFYKIPIEEVLFFFIIPFSSLFIHFAFVYAYPKLKLGNKLTKILTLSLTCISVVIAALNYTKAYTVVNFYVLACSLLLALAYKPAILSQFYLSFAIILIPFGIVNGALTGSFTPDPIVWYDNSQNLGIRIATIPVEDIGYAFSMLLMNLTIFDFLSAKTSITHDNVSIPQ